ncbi:diguanylate cyclase [Pandoraea nosoerga]|uniref:diguanylate cyclase n=1 Tax=Pandoraea nosoerga TaxID=2508296 RepID=A0A5E4V6X7_9BURK|nr:diguanylate cyclase [Pandoraea nosoerga]MBN4665777.1 diguanylate cyclase [Pandoraea nosoerga]MBN4677484.1 diguanylate cyclase [Pandoraea nosoerga]MBN4681092.1 diguanylate cyclase [Pandoraea nosoerga]MBN4746618.1 diguanylate cyclase [Pandoraea nosoerga]VVE07926.1 diguanylate cyclase [Pandoraea nosoerga]
MSSRPGAAAVRKWITNRLEMLFDKFDDYPAAIGIVGTIIAGAILIGVGLLLNADRQARRVHAMERAESVASVVATSLGGNIAVYDALLKEMVREAEVPGMPLFTERMRDRVRFGQALSQDFLDDAYVVDREGRIAAPLHPVHGRSVSVADRDYFRSHETSPSLGLYISQPYASRTRDGMLSVALTRRIAAVDHSFAGVAVIALRLDHLGALVANVESDDLETIDIVEDKGTVLACEPCSGSRPGALVRLPGDAARESDLAAALSFPAGARSPDYRSVRVPGASLYVVVTPSTETAMRGWRWHAAVFLLIAAVCAATLMAGSWLLVAAVRTRVKAATRLANLSATDGLTGLSNRRALDVRLKAEWRRAQHSGRPLSILFADIDHFKHFNDTYGHSVGDDVLRAVATNIGAHTRSDADMAARYGGEEFAVVLPDTDAQGAAAMAEQVRRDVERLHIAHVGSTTGAVTISVGAATGTAGECDSAEAILKAADEQLFIAKQSGRNRISTTVLGAAASAGLPPTG